MVLTVGTLAMLMAAAWGAGAALLANMKWPELRRLERVSLELTAGLGVVATMLSASLLLHAFAWATTQLILTAAGGAWIARARERRAPPQALEDVSLDAGTARITPAPPLGAAAILAAAIVACAGAIAPVTDHDALSYVVPIAHHIAREGALRVWTDQAPSMWPQSHTVLLAYIVRAGGDRLAALSALEWLIAIGAIAALARRTCERSDRVLLAVALTIAAPAAAFQVASAKEDMLLCAATAGALFCAARAPATADAADAAAVGLFAGVAAGVKYPGMGVAAATIAWIAVAWRGRRAAATLTAVAAAAATGGVWYALNLWRFWNPVAPFVFGAPGTPLDAGAVRSVMENYGGGRSVLNFFATPIRIFVEQGPYAGRAALFHPLICAGVAALFVPRLRARSAPLLFTAAVLYAGWYLTLQNARLLLPAAVALAPVAAGVLGLAMKRSGWISFGVLAAVGVPLALAPAVGVVRATRYLSDPAAYLARQTEHYSGVQWANTHLDPARHRVLSMFGVVGYFTVPAIGLDPLHQLEFAAFEIADHNRLIAACRRQGVTHIFTARHDLDDVHSQLRLVFEDSRSPLGDAHFFRAAPLEATAIFEVLPAGAIGEDASASGAAGR